MTKTNLVLLVGGACAFALLASGSTRRCEADTTVTDPASYRSVVWEQPPGVPPTGRRGTRPKQIQQIAWEQPPGVPPTGGRDKRPKGAERVTVVPV